MGQASNRELLARAAGLFVALGLTLSALVIQGISAEIRLLLSLVGALLGLVIALMARVIESEVKLRDRIEYLNEDLGAKLQAVSRAFPLAGAIAVAPELEGIARAAMTVQGRRGDFLAARLMDRIKDLQRTAKSIVDNGTVTCLSYEEEYRLLRQALKSSGSYFQAVATLGFDHWRKASWREYFRCFEEHAQDHQGDSRIFLVDPENLTHEGMLQLLQRHSAAGITTYALDKNRIDPNLVRASVIFGEELLLSHSAHHAEHVEVTFSDDAGEIESARERFEALLSYCQDDEIVLWPK